MENSNNCCKTNQRVLLHEFLQKTLRESPKLIHLLERNTKSVKSLLYVEGARFQGDFQFCDAAAKESAADKALTQLQGMCENELRVMLKMPKKKRFPAIDGIRDEMKILKKCLQPSYHGRDVMQIIGRIYQHVDEMEARLQDPGVDVIDGHST